jgi:hypothetical protein
VVQQAGEVLTLLGEMQPLQPDVPEKKKGSVK